MKTLALVCAALIAAPAMAEEMVSYRDGNTIRLGEGDCTSELVLNQVEPALQTQFRSASVELEGQKFAACWRVTPAGAFLIYEDGDQGLVPFNSLKPLLSI